MTTVLLILLVGGFSLGLLIGVPSFVVLMLGRKRQLRRRWKVLSSAGLIVGLLMIVPPLCCLFYMRAVNGSVEPEGAYLDLNEKAICQYEKIDGRWHNEFSHSGNTWAEILPEGGDGEICFAEDIECNVPEKNLTEDNAVLNILPKRTSLEVLFNMPADERTLYSVSSGSGIGILAGDAEAYCPQDQLSAAEDYYEDIRSYDRFMFSSEDKEVKVDLDPKRLSPLQRLDQADQKPVTGGKSYSLACTSSDGVFAADVQLLHKGRSWYLRTGEVETDDDIEDLYIKLPKDLSAYFEQALQGVKE